MKRLDLDHENRDSKKCVNSWTGVLRRHALDGARLSFENLGAFSTNLASGDIRRQAVLNRSDVLSALAEYAASESALQVQIAKQYPDLQLRPGNELDQTKNKWQLGVSFDLPILNQNQGPIAEANAKRAEIAAKFNSIQAKAIGDFKFFSASAWPHCPPEPRTANLPPPRKLKTLSRKPSLPPSS